MDLFRLSGEKHQDRNISVNDKNKLNFNQKPSDREKLKIK